MGETVIIIVFALILYQDLRYRGVHWVLFPLLLAAGLFLAYDRLLLSEIAYNLLFLLFILTALSLYLSIKFGRLINITKGFFGLGDVLFLIAIIPLFSFREYLIFFTLGTLAALLLHLLSAGIRKQKSIPYAGYMAFAGALCVGFNDVFNEFIELL